MASGRTRREACALISANSNEPRWYARSNIPSSTPKSPMRLATNALRPA
ncbi:MAG: hypothetical protein FD124_3873, partial [Alphaproteobacteria bacterium]